MKYKVLIDNIHIEDSYKTKSETEMIDFLSFLQDNYTEKDCPILYKRKMSSLVNEWKAHNLLYKLGLFKSHTKDVDLNFEPWYRRFVYAILAKLY